VNISIHKIYTNIFDCDCEIFLYEKFANSKNIIIDNGKKYVPNNTAMVSPGSLNAPPFHHPTTK